MNEERDKEEVNRYLAEAMGNKYHAVKQYSEIKDNRATSAICECGEYLSSDGSLNSHVRFFGVDYSTAIGYDKLREFYDGFNIKAAAKFQKWLFRYYSEDATHTFNAYNTTLHAFHKDRLSTLMYEFLKEEK